MVKELTKISVYDLNGKKVETLDVPVLNIDEDQARKFVSDVAIMYEANRKRNMGHAKTRAEVHHTTAKPFKQKGTGRARQGMTSSPVMVGGGVAFPPRYKVIKKKIGKKVKEKALNLGLMLKIIKNKFKVIVSGEKEGLKTKEISKFLSAMKLKSSLFVLDKQNNNFTKSACNIPKTAVMRYQDLNVYDLLRYDSVVLTRDAFSDAIKRCEKELKKKSKK
jgi:large subunit ribosomal protein L4